MAQGGGDAGVEGQAQDSDGEAAGMVPRSDHEGVRTAMINSRAMPVPLLTHLGASPIPATPGLTATLPTPWT